MGAKLDVRALEIGDYVLSDDVAVERKTSDDFLESLVNKKRNLFEQLTNLTKNYKNPVLVIEGNDIQSRNRRQISQESIRGAFLTIKIDMNIAVISTKDEQETALILFMIAQREQKERKKSVRHHGKKTFQSTPESQIYILSSIPGIGVHAAKLLLNHFGSLKEVFNANKEELMQVKGIGEKTGERISRIIETKYKGQ